MMNPLKSANVNILLSINKIIFKLDIDTIPPIKNNLFSTSTFTHIITSNAFNINSPLEGWMQPIGATEGNTASVRFADGAVALFTFEGNEWILTLIDGSQFANNLMVNGVITERGNINPGGSQPADYKRNIYNWLGTYYQDKWQSTGDQNLFDINANQTVVSTNTINAGQGAINIGSRSK
ncbi:MAG: hypothetical protein IPH57_12665 [Saprospiraceae bacterium]|nr:hypothetical protein [Saprospiraceae bacterium]